MVVVLIFYFNSVAPHSASVHIAYKYTTPGEKKQQQQLTPTTFRAFSLKKKNSLHLILEKHGFRVFQKFNHSKISKIKVILTTSRVPLGQYK